jgi:hypothetical protein
MLELKKRQTLGKHDEIRSMKSTKHTQRMEMVYFRYNQEGTQDGSKELRARRWREPRDHRAPPDNDLFIWHRRPEPDGSSQQAAPPPSPWFSLLLFLS